MPSDLERLYDEHASALFAFLLNFTRDENDTRDVLQEIFIKLARQPDLALATLVGHRRWSWIGLSQNADRSRLWGIGCSPRVAGCLGRKPARSAGV